ncbi:MAG: hypothetical protein ACTS73_04430 [Arsenophonus sp. NEOnobi-MAG3]
MADAIYSPVRKDNRLFLLVIIGVTNPGRKELVLVENAYQKLETNLPELLNALQEAGALTVSPRLTTGSGTLVFRMQ